MDLSISRGKAFLFILITWSILYLPGLGREGFKHEEGRRVLPAVEMLKTGNLILPRVAGQDYYNKPPGINWLVAGSFWLTGEQSELTARLPSAVFVLIFVSLLIWIPNQWLSVPARLMSAIIFMTNIALIEYGRLIEIEAVYISLTGIAILLWLNTWSRNGPGWLLWLAPSIVLGFGMLVKGPFILIFFYSVVISALCYSKKFKSLFSVWHITGVGIISFMFLGWLWLAFQQTSATRMSSQMSGQLLMRIFGKFDVSYWGRNVVTAFAAFLPWLLFVPMFWDKKLTAAIEPSNMPLFRGCRVGTLIGFCVIILMPKMEARYAFPVIPVASVLLGWLLSLRKEAVSTDYLWRNVLLTCLVIACLSAVFGLIYTAISVGAVIALVIAVCATVIAFRKRNEIKDAPGLTLMTALVFIVGMLQYTSYGQDIAVSQETRRPAAMAINKAVPAGQTIYIFKPTNFLNPALFYLRPPVDYVLDANDVNEQMRYVLIKEKDLESLEGDKKIDAGSVEVLYVLTDKIPGAFRFVRLGQSRN